MLRVLGRTTSINVRKVLWALDELGLRYDREDWGTPIRDPNVPEFLSLNPNGQVPVLIEGDFVLWESNAILTYLAEREGRLIPDQLEQRALVLQWLGWQATELNPPWGYAVRALLRNVPGHDDPKQIEKSMRDWGAKMALLDAHLVRTTDFVVQGQFSIADIALGLSIHRWMCIPLDKPAFPSAEAYYHRLKDTEAGGRWMTAATP